MTIKHNDGYHTTSKWAGNAFMAMYQGRGDGLVEVFRTDQSGYGTMMVVPSEDGVVYITKEQAMAFFNLVEPEYNRSYPD